MFGLKFRNTEAKTLAVIGFSFLGLPFLLLPFFVLALFGEIASGLFLVFLFVYSGGAVIWLPWALGLFCLFLARSKERAACRRDIPK